MRAVGSEASVKAMFKNTAGQKVTVFAYDYSTSAPKTGDAANISVYLQKDDGSITQLTDTSAAEVSSTNAPGCYLFDVSQTETNADKLVFTGKSATANVAIRQETIYTRPAAFGIPGGAAGGVLIAGTNVATAFSHGVVIDNANTDGIGLHIRGSGNCPAGCVIQADTTSLASIASTLGLPGNFANNGLLVVSKPGATGNAVFFQGCGTHSIGMYICGFGSVSSSGVYFEGATGAPAFTLQAGGLHVGGSGSAGVGLQIIGGTSTGTGITVNGVAGVSVVGSAGIGVAISSSTTTGVSVIPGGTASAIVCGSAGQGVIQAQFVGINSSFRLTVASATANTVTFTDGPEDDEISLLGAWLYPYGASGLVRKVNGRQVIAYDFSTMTATIRGEWSATSTPAVNRLIGVIQCADVMALPIAEPTAVPDDDAAMIDKQNWVATVARNKITQTATTQTVRNDSDNADIASADVADDGSTFTRGAFA